MADIYQNWTLYNVSKVTKAGVDYHFDWSMADEYNQLLSNYNQLQSDYWDLEDDYEQCQQNYQAAVEQWEINWLFMPASYILEDVISNDDSWITINRDLWDIANADNSAYYHYFWFLDSTTTAYDMYRVWCWKKTPKSNPSFAASDRLSEMNYSYYSLNMDWWWRMKRDWNDVKASALAYRQYDSNWWNVSWWTYSTQFYCINFTNQSWTIVDLWNYSWYYSKDNIPQEVLDNWTTSCWITQEESIASINKTTTSFTRWSTSSRYNLVATLV